MDTRIVKNGNPIPVVAFFGTKGGVGKTTIARRFAELITLAKSSPNVLLVDSDVHHRGMTVEMAAQTSLPRQTVHDYIAGQNTSDVEATNVSGVIQGHRTDSGKLFFIPASAPESAQIFEKSAKIGPEKLLKILFEVISKATAKYDCDCVVIDCGPIVDPYTAAAATLSDRAFIIGQNEPISFSSLKTYASRIRDFYPEFTTTNMKIIINKVRGFEQLEQRKLQTQEDIFAAIPFTMDIVDVSEGLGATDEMRLMMFEDHIAQIATKVFKGDHPELVPERRTLLPPQWNSLLQKADRLEQAPQIKRLGLLRFLLPIGLLVVVIGGILFYSASTERYRAEAAAQALELVQALEGKIAEAKAAGNSAVGQLQQALDFAKGIDPQNPEDLAQALQTAQEAGLEKVPALKQQDTTLESTGIGTLLGGIVIASIGFFSFQSRKNYLRVIQGLRKNGADWLMAEMKTSRSTRKTLDKLLKMAANQ
jgi:cellulose biosynthesis protein BcsQ